MIGLTQANPALLIADADTRRRADELLLIHQRTIWSRTDRLFAGLLAFEWLAAIVVAWTTSPLTWNGATSRVHPHLIASIALGGAIVVFPILLACFASGRASTRHIIAIAQMAMSALLIHLGNGRIEVHFHIFGSLAFLAFYRDWRVLITASVVVALDHLLRGIYAPQSVYGVLSASGWRTVEHAAWVVFEDIFLITSCGWAVREMRGIAQNQALLEQSHRDVEKKVLERTAELKRAQDDLLKSARSAGMAEIATSVLHNVGNVLNSVNVSATLVAGKLRDSELPTLNKVSELLIENKPHLATFLTEDERGKLVPDFITDLSNCLGEQHEMMVNEVASLSKGIEHIKQIVAAQQSMAKKTQLVTEVEPGRLFDSALTMQGTFAQDVEIQKDYEPQPAAMLDEHKVLQILINLISNARQAVQSRPAGNRKLTLKLQRITSPGGDRIRFQVGDSGVGIAAEHLTRIFSHGFTTKKEGHGFGLHSAANAATEMRGTLSATSDGANKGATFTLEVPIVSVNEGVACTL